MLSQGPISARSAGRHVLERAGSLAPRMRRSEKKRGFYGNDDILVPGYGHDHRHRRCQSGINGEERPKPHTPPDCLKSIELSN